MTFLPPPTTHRPSLRPPAASAKTNTAPLSTLEVSEAVLTLEPWSVTPRRATTPVALTRTQARSPRWLKRAHEREEGAKEG